MKKDELLKLFVPMVDYIADIVGPHCEVVLHAVSDLENSIVAIRNGHISGRLVGGALTDLGLKLLQEKAYHSKEALVNYPARTKEGKLLRSSTFFIKDGNGEIVGMLCVNIDITAALEARQFINDFILGIDQQGQEQQEEKRAKSECQEVLNNSVEDLMNSLIEQTIESFDVPPERMSPEEKMSVVQKLNEKGLFLLKGTVAEVARYLKTSESTIYRYLSKK